LKQRDPVTTRYKKKGARGSVTSAERGFVENEKEGGLLLRPYARVMTRKHGWLRKPWAKKTQNNPTGNNRAHRTKTAFQGQTFIGKIQ